MKIIMFGGNGFMGSETTKLLLKDNHEITLLSRGRWPWDTSETIKPYVKHIYCDRHDPEKCLEEISKFETKFDTKFETKFDIVIDFSAFRVTDVRPFYPWLKKIISGIYIYISSDSVYEVCEITTESPIREQAAIRPLNPIDREKLNLQDDYGNRKLSIEEYLKEQADQGGIPYVALRLPDVLGPKDSTKRWWKYQLWMRYANSIPLPVPNQIIDLKTSFVFVEDVAKQITKIVNMPNNWTNLHNKAYNLAYPGSKSLVGFLTDLREALGLEDKVKLALGEEGKTFNLPSVTFGWLDVTRAEKELGWTCRDWKKMILDTSMFYNQAEHQFQTERNDCLKALLKGLKEFLDETVYEQVEKSFKLVMDTV